MCSLYERDFKVGEFAPFAHLPLNTGFDLPGRPGCVKTGNDRYYHEDAGTVYMRDIEQTVKVTKVNTEGVQ